MSALDQLTQHPFLAGMSDRWLDQLASLATLRVHHIGDRLFAEGARADRFWLLGKGRVSLEFHVDRRGDISIEQLGAGSVLGWSWMFPPYRWHFGAVAAEQTQSIELDGPGVRKLCGQDPAFGYELTTRFSGVLVDRLQAARIRLVELYSYPTS